MAKQIISIQYAMCCQYLDDKHANTRYTGETEKEMPGPFSYSEMWADANHPKGCCSGSSNLSTHPNPTKAFGAQLKY